jgi:hypothetical protein
VLLEGDKEFSPRIGKILTSTARLIARILDEGKARGDFHPHLESLATAHAILGAISGATQQSLANRSLTVETLLAEAREMTLARVRR